MLRSVVAAEISDTAPLGWLVSQLHGEAVYCAPICLSGEINTAFRHLYNVLLSLCRLTGPTINEVEWNQYDEMASRGFRVRCFL